MGNNIKKKRKQLLDEKSLLKHNDIYELKIDYIFTSPSAASDFVLGRASNGWIEWKYEDGKTLDEVKRQK